MTTFSDSLSRGHVHRASASFDRRPITELRIPVVGRRGPTQREIAELAYSYWEARGRRHGSALEDWLSAERDLQRRYQW
jgi:hypothetical protein